MYERRELNNDGSYNYCDMNNDKASYREILKSTSIFGGVQVVLILVSIIRSKLVAVLLGTAGMGVLGLFNSTINLILGIIGFNIGASAVKGIASANEKGDTTEVARITTIVKKLVWVTGLVGAVCIFLFSSRLSQMTFGNENYVNSFRWLSASLLFTRLTSGYNVILQGVRKLAYLAKGNLLGALLSFIVTIPLYYIYKVDGIVPGLILSSVCTLILAWYYMRKCSIPTVIVSTQEFATESRTIIKIGFFVSLTSIASSIEGYAVRVFISNHGVIDDVGLFNAGFAIIEQYIGLIFTAMSTDFYPRLAAITNDKNAYSKLMHQQAEVAILIITPLLCAFLVFVDWGIILLYSDRFLPIKEMIHWAALGVFLKVLFWIISTLFIASSNAKLYSITQTSFVLVMLSFNILGYKYYGLEGLGISFLMGYIVSFLIVYIVAKKKYQFVFSNSFFKIFFTQLTLATLSFLVVQFFPSPTYYFVGSAILLSSVYLSFKRLNKIMDIKELLSRFKKTS